MATEIRPELSEKNPYWIGKHRYYELKHFCLQYPIWKKAYNALLGLSSRPNDLDIFVKSGQVRSDPTARCAESRVSFAKRMELVEQAAIGTDGDLYLDITAPLYWWKEFDTYKVGTVANSCSTMHKITDKPFELDDFSHEHLGFQSVRVLKDTIKVMNDFREEFIKDHEKENWWQMIQLLPSSYNQKRTVMLNYEVLANIYKSRRHHKLDEWHTLCDRIESLPYSELITGTAV